MLSPLLFNLVADGMARILKAIIRKELCRCFVNQTSKLIRLPRCSREDDGSIQKTRGFILI